MDEISDLIAKVKQDDKGSMISEMWGRVIATFLVIVVIGFLIVMLTKSPKKTGMGVNLNSLPVPSKISLVK